MAANQIKGGAVLSYVSLIVGNIIVLFYTPFMLRMMGQSEYGIYSICNTISSTIAMLDSGLGLAAVKYVTQNKNSKELPSVLGTFFLFYALLGFIALILSGFIAENASTIFMAKMTAEEVSSIRIILWITGLYLFFSFFTSVFVATVVAYERFIFIKVLDIIKSCMLPLLIIPFLLEGYKAIAMSTITVCVFLLVNIIKTIYCFTKLRIRISFKGISFSFIRSAIPFAAIVFLKLLLDNIYWTGGHLVLGIVAGTIPAAVFAVAIQMRGYFCAVANPVNNLFLPRCVELSKEENGMTQESNLFLKVSRIQTIILGLVVSGYFVFGKHFMILWAGSDYIDAYRASLIIMVPYIIPLAQGILNSVLQAYNKLKFQLFVYFFTCLSVIGGTFVLGRYEGAMGAAYIMVFSILLFEIVLMSFYYQRIGIDIKLFWRNTIRILSPYLVISVILRFTVSEHLPITWPSLLIGLIAFVVISLPIEYFFVMNEEERGYVKSVLRRKF